MGSLEEALRAFKDVDGVHGSFVVDLSGGLLARELPSAFDNQLFAEVGPRVARFYEAFTSGGEEMDACLLRFQEHKLYLRKMSAGIVGILSGIRVNMPALRMIANLVIRRVDAEVARLASLPRPAVAPAEALPPMPPLRASVSSKPPTSEAGQAIVPEDGRDSVAPAASERHVRMYRGRPVQE